MTVGDRPKDGKRRDGMKEVRLRYPAHAIANSEFKDQISICQEAVLMASVSRHYEKDTIVYVLQLTLTEGMTVEDIDRVPWFRHIEVIGEEIVGGRVLVTALVENSHALLKLGRDIWNAVVAPGSSIGVSGANIIVRGTPAGCSAMVKGFQSWNPNGTVSVVRLTEQEGGDFAGLTEHQMHAFSTAWRLGYYERPRKCTLADVATEIGVSRATISGHLGAVENTAHRRLAARLGLRDDGTL